MKGLLFHIQRFSTKDGPGIRTTAFFKGCNLRCLWCHNPESLSGRKELKYYRRRCLRCGLCRDHCPAGAIRLTAGRWQLEEERCTLCGACAAACPQGAIELCGREYTPEQLTAELLKDRAFYDDSGGGVTFSGGEALVQSRFLRACLRRLKTEGIHTAVDTALAVEWEAIQPVLPYTDMLLLDIKGLDREAHLRNTGADPAVVWDNIRKLRKQSVHQSPQVILRLPLVDTINIETELLPVLADRLTGWENLLGIELLPYHSLGAEKAAELASGIRQEEYAPPAEEVLEEIRAFLEKANLKVLHGEKEKRNGTGVY